MIKFKECLQKIEDIDTSSGLCLDVPTRWKSTFFIFKVFLNTNRFFQIFTPSWWELQVLPIRGGM